MKRRLFCLALCLGLLCSMLVTPAMASHTCTDADNDGWCDTCYDTMPHFCYSCDGDAWCDVCYETMKHTCMYNDGYAICGKCFEPTEHTCVDSDQDYWCDMCFDLIAHTCKDTNRDYLCDLCYMVQDHTCKDTDGDYWCDICDEWFEHDCRDNNRDFYCDLCYYPVSHDCMDSDGDMYCDICYDVVLSEEWFTNISGTAKSSLDNLEPVYIDIYDEVGTYINFAILTGDDPAYDMMVLTQTSYNIYVSKADHVTRTYTLDVNTSPADLDVKICPIGDATGDGKVNMGDAGRVYSHIRGTSKLTDDYALDCADVSGDGKLNMGDAGRIYAHIRGTTPLW